MNRLPSSAVAIAAEDLQWAKSEVTRAGKKLIEVLEERLACGRMEFMGRLAATLHMPGVTLDELRVEEPAFDLIP
ncbi:MAG TPA: hypothetical protein VE958_01110, partial [Bryobacteraceae bacterium]|nr:hypothetical protein [Bryobacteraceae bacterium]